VEARTDIPQTNRKREESLSSDGKWRSFPKVPNLLQYVSNGNYYGRIKVGGKTIRESLETSVSCHLVLIYCARATDEVGDAR
jgi:hypothetical protein